MERNRNGELVAVGLVVGVGIGTATGAVAGADLVTGSSFGAGGGIIIAAAVATLWRPATPRFALASALAGLGVGAVLGGLAAWTADAAVLDGLLVGGVPGMLLGAFLAYVARRDGETPVDSPSD